VTQKFRDELNDIPSLRKRSRPPLRLRDLRTIPEARRHIAGHFREGQLVLLYGPSGSCKTFVGLAWANAIATGIPYLGLYPVRQGKAVYLYSEGSQGCRKRCEAWLTHHDRTDLPDDAVFMPYSYNLADEGDADEIVDEVERSIGTPSLVVIDTLARNHSGDENSASDVGRLVRTIDRFRHRWECSVVIVHHSGKAAEKRERGSSALRAACDGVFAVSATDRHVTITHEKSKDDSLLPPYKIAKKVIDLGVDDEGEPRSSLVLVGDGSAAVKPAGPKPSIEERIQESILATVSTVPLNTTRVLAQVRAEWPERYPGEAAPSDRKITPVLKSLKGHGIEWSKGDRNADLWRRVPQ